MDIPRLNESKAKVLPAQGLYSRFMKKQPRTIDPKPKPAVDPVAAAEAKLAKPHSLQNTLTKDHTVPAWPRAATRLQPKQTKGRGNN